MVEVVAVNVGKVTEARLHDHQDAKGEDAEAVLPEEAPSRRRLFRGRLQSRPSTPSPPSPRSFTRGQS